MKKIGIISKPNSPAPPEILKELVPWLQEKGMEIYLEHESAAFGNLKTYARTELPDLVELILVLGGDGTMLGASRLVAHKGIPVLGVNLGGLGFITEVYKEEMFDALERIFKGECPTEERLMLEARILRGGEEISRYTALNDVVINKGSIARLIELEITVNDKYVTTFLSDGTIVSTPTGSTAYSMSAGGPILYPTLHAMVLTPICPHTLTNRPLVLPENAVINMHLKSETEGTLLSLDGQVGFTLMTGDIVEVRKSEYNAILLKPCDRDHFDILRTKLNWGGR